MVPTLMTLVFTAMVYTYRGLTITAQDVLERGWWCRVQAHMSGMPPSPFPGPSAFGQRGSQSSDIRPSSLFLQQIGSLSPGLWVQYIPISGGNQGPWCQGCSNPSLPSEFEGQSDNSRMEIDSESQAFQVLTTCLDILLCLCLLMLSCWVVSINTV